jgi:hypothetical protein
MHQPERRRVPGPRPGPERDRGRGQPAHSRNILVGQNDYRRGDGACGADWSQDGGRHWGSELAPLSFTAPGFTGARHYWDASGDPSVAFDSSGEAYLFCLAFNRAAPTSDVNSAASGLFVFRSANGGASWSFPGSLVKKSDGTGADGIGLLDKPYMAVDTSRSSDFRDRIYVAWAEYNVNFSAAQISFAWSGDHGATWNLTGAISGFSPALCPVNFSGACVPTAPLSDTSIFRATNYPSGVAVTNDRIVVTFGSYINRHSNPTRGNCTPEGFSATTGLNLYDGVGDTNGCNNDIVVSVSTDGGSSFTGTTTPVAELPSLSDERPGGQLADQFWQWAALNPASGKVTVAYYDRKYGDAQQTGEMDITLRRGNGSHVRVTNRSLPPTQEFPEAGASTGIFLGDYMGMAVGSDGVAHPVWTDTRNPIFSPSTGGDVRELVHAGQGSDIYTRALPG